MSRGRRDLHAVPPSATTDMMTGRNTKLTASVETYFDDLRRVRSRQLHSSVKRHRLNRTTLVLQARGRQAVDWLIRTSVCRTSHLRQIPPQLQARVPFQARTLRGLGHVAVLDWSRRKPFETRRGPRCTLQAQANSGHPNLGLIRQRPLRTLLRRRRDRRPVCRLPTDLRQRSK